jgi:restriction system protein
MDRNLWLVRGGENGCFEDAALSNGVMIAGWSELGDLSEFTRKSDIREKLTKCYPDITKSKASHWIPQIWYFCNEIRIKDIISMPIKSKPYAMIGVVEGNYQYINNEKYHHIRKVKWFKKKVFRLEIDDDIRYSLGCLGAICKVRKENAAGRILKTLSN